MRIIGGIASGKRIHTPKGCSIRPTSDKIKESIFNMICPLEGQVFLDLFAGTGSIGLEALSRGAWPVIFVEKNIRLTEAIQKNIYECGFEDKNYEILAVDVQAAIKRLSQRKIKFELLFADPPYEDGFIHSTLQCLENSTVLSDESLVILQHSYREALNNELAHFQLIDQRKYGDTLLSFLTIKSPLQEDTSS
jgi:16S rRNA (guanine(966)-N(2))-methyltransferase RsmD